MIGKLYIYFTCDNMYWHYVDAFKAFTTFKFNVNIYF